MLSNISLYAHLCGENFVTLMSRGPQGDYSNRPQTGTSFSLIRWRGRQSTVSAEIKILLSDFTQADTKKNSQSDGHEGSAQSPPR